MSSTSAIGHPEVYNMSNFCYQSSPLKFALGDSHLNGTLLNKLWREEGFCDYLNNMEAIWEEVSGATSIQWLKLTMMMKKSQLLLVLQHVWHFSSYYKTRSHESCD